MSARGIVHALTLWPAGMPENPAAALLTYDATDPYAARLAFVRGNRETVAYVFGRDLLAKGLYDPAGEGDVMVGPHDECEHYLVLTLTPDVGYPIAFHVQRAQVADFVTEAYRLVPMGCEGDYLAPWDAELAAVLGGAS